MLGLIKLRTINKLSDWLVSGLSAEISSDLKVLTILLHSDTVVGFYISGIENLSLDSSPDIQHFTVPNISWQKHQGNGLKGNHQILFGNKQGEIRLDNIFCYDNNKLGIKNLSKWSLHDIDTQIQLFESKDELDYEVFSYRGNQALLCIDNLTIITVIITPDQPLFVRSHHLLSEDGSKAKHVQCIDNIICYMNHNGSNISAIDLEYGTQLWSFSVTESLNISKFFISPNSTYLVLVGPDDFYYSDLSCCFRKHLKKKSTKSVITAFSKQSVAVINKQEGKSKARETRFLDLEKGNLRSVLFSENRVFLTVLKDNCSLFYSFIFDGNIEFQKKFHGGCTIVNSDDNCCPPLILSGDELFSYSPESSTTEFVNKLMTYSSGHIVEYLSLLNQWQGISIELDILELGLKNSQLDTVTFFFRAKCEEFQAVWKNYVRGNLEVDVLNAKLSNWAKIIEILKHSLTSKLKSSSFLQFGEQILKVTICVLIQLIKTVSTELPTTSEKQYKEFFFTKALKEIRLFLKNKVETRPEIEKQVFENDVFEQWASMSEEEIILNSIENSLIPVALWYFNNQANNTISLEYIQKVAKELSVYLLELGEINNATILLINSGLNPTGEFLEVFHKTTSRSLRNFLLPQLETQSALTQEDLNAVVFIQTLEKLYPCSDFSQAKEHKLEVLDELEIQFPIKSLLKEADYSNIEAINEAVIAESYLKKDKSNWEGFSYCQISLETVKKLNHIDKQQILVPSVLTIGVDLDVNLAPSAKVVWIYLLERSMTTHLTKWINTFYENSSEELPKAVFPNGWEITIDMINFVPGSLATTTVKEIVLNTLAKYGVICEDELEDIGLLLKRMGAAGVVLAKTHPFSLPRASMLERDYFHRVVHYCLEHSLLNFLYFFLHDERRYLKCIFCPVCRVPLVVAMIDFCRWSESPDNENLRYQAILSSGFLLNNVPESSLEALCRNSTANITLASMFFSPLKLSDLLETEHLGLKESLEYSLSNSPLLHRVLFQQWPTKINDDITIYNLLVGNSFFDPTRLFGWQLANRVANEEAPSEMPHFSSPRLVQEHALNQNIDANYYLICGRANYAYLKFVAQELATWKTLSNQRLSLACVEASNTALKNYATPKVTSACITFIELLGLDSSKLRVDVQVALILHKEHFKRSEDDRELTQLVTLLSTMNESKDVCKKILMILDSVIFDKISSSNKYTPKNLDYYLFITLVQFLNFHQLEYLPNFLSIYAKHKDWFSLTVLLQMLKIPREQALEIVRKIPDKCLVDHFITAFQSPASSTYGTKITKTRSNSVVKNLKPKLKETVDARSALYSKIGLGKAKISPTFSSAGDTTDDEVLVSDDGSSSINTDDSSIDYCLGQPKDLFEQLLLASRNPNPGLTLLQTSISFKNPIHALIAASLTDTDWTLCACTWIISILRLELKLTEQEIYPGKLNVGNFTLNNFSDLLRKLVQMGYLKILNKCCHFFLPHSPILPLSDFLVQFFYSKKFKSSVVKLEEFKFKMASFESEISKNKHSIGDLWWIEDLSLKLIQDALILSKSCYEQKLFLHHLFSLNFGLVFISGIPVFDSQLLYSLLVCVEDCEIEVPINDLFYEKTNPVFIKAAVSIVDDLQTKRFYAVAKQFGELANIPKETVVVSQLNNEAEALEQSFNCRKSFWEMCDNTFDIQKIDAVTAVSFFEKWCEKALTYMERFYILICIVKWSKKAGSIDLVEKEMSMWLCCFQCKMESLLKNTNSENSELVIESYAGNSTDLCNWELWDFESVNSEQEPLQLKFETEQMALDEVLLSLLDLGYVGQAWKLAVMFKYYSFELEAVLTCLKLVREIILPSQIDSKVVEILNGKGESLSILEIIEKIQQTIKRGKIACQRIKMHYQVSQMLWSSYIQIAADKDSMRLFLNILNCSNPGRFNFAKELCLVRKIPDDDVVSCIYEKIIEHIKNSVILTDAKVVEISFKDDGAFSQKLFRLCKEPSSLGYKLLGDLADSDEETTSKKSHIYQVVICITCHTCFTACCNMEGISKTLQKARQLTLELEEKEEFTLMLCLLTGIGRYGEMTYIFDILREHEQFDILLKKNTEELPLLRLALLDYLKRHHGVSDREVHSMLTLKFKMLREIAKMLETSANDRLKKLSLNDLGKPNLRTTLEAILQDLEAATKKYVEDGCLRLAQKCLRKAELVALQIHLSFNNIWIFQLDQPAVHKFLIEQKQFMHSFIVASAYEHDNSWDQALYQNLIERSDWEYFRDFQAKLSLTPELIKGVAKRYSLSRSKGERQQHNMKRLLNFCEDVAARYHLANQLGFMDVTSDLLKGDGGPYLQDVISQKKLQEEWLLNSI